MTGPIGRRPNGRVPQALRDALGQLAAGRRRTLVAAFASVEARRGDENLLVYNVGVSAFAHLHVDEAVLARSWDPPAPPAGARMTLTHHHHYDSRTGHRQRRRVVNGWWPTWRRRRFAFRCASSAFGTTW